MFGKNIIIYGAAGTGKSTKLANLINDSFGAGLRIKICAPTHVAVHNIKEICQNMNEDIPDSLFSTLHTTFRVFDDETFLGSTEIFDQLFIDEFSMINKDLMLKCITSSRLKNPNIDIYICGDILQLPPIVTNEKYISMTKLCEFGDMLSTINTSEFIFILKHISNMVISENIKWNEVVHVTQNKRSSGEMSKLINQIYFGNITEIADKYFVNNFKILIPKINNGAVCIAPTYKQLYNLYKLYNSIRSDIVVITQNGSYDSGFEKLFLRKGDKLMATKTTKEFKNGDVFVFEKYISEIDTIECENNIFITRVAERDTTHTQKYFPVVPSNFITIHKSQGRSINDVIICIDNMFEVSMLYTAITRARNNIWLYYESEDKYESLQKSAFISEFINLNKFIELLFHKL